MVLPGVLTLHPQRLGHGVEHIRVPHDRARLRRQEILFLVSHIEDAQMPPILCQAFLRVRTTDQHPDHVEPVALLRWINLLSVRQPPVRLNKRRQRPELILDLPRRRRRVIAHDLVYHILCGRRL